MKYDTAKSTHEIRQMADVIVVALVVWLSAITFGTAASVIAAAILISQKWRGPLEGSFWCIPTIRLTILALTLVWLASNWSSYRRGVFAGYDAAAQAMKR